MNTKFTIGDVVLYKGVKHKVVDITFDDTYDLREVDGDGEYLDIQESELTKVEVVKKKFRVHYSFYLSESIDISAETEEEAERICEEMIECGEIGNLNEMEIGDQKVWVD